MVERYVDIVKVISSILSRPPGKMHYTYRKDIDGLRALAVLPVIFYHAGFKLFSGGFVGVDIFFVISGYLITNIILKDLSEKFSIINFYERRARRILPALFTVILATSLLSYIFLTKSELGFYFQSVIATVFFFSNFYFGKTHLILILSLNFNHYFIPGVYQLRNSFILFFQ